MHDDLIAALGRLFEAWDDDAHYELSEADTELFRALIDDLRAGNLVRRESDVARVYLGEAQYEAGVAHERARVVAYLRRVGLTPKARDLFATAAGHIAAGAHEGGGDE